MSFSRLQKVGIWAWDDVCWLSFFSRLWGWGTVTLQLSGFYCSLRRRGSILGGSWASWVRLTYI